MLNRENIDFKSYDLLLLSTTSKKGKEFVVLPSRTINGFLSLNVLVTDEKYAIDILQKADGVIDTILVDVEGKQEINLWQIAREKLQTSKLLPYKPNDVTLEAADQLLLNHFLYDVTEKNIMIYGTGNIATKLAIRLAERNANVFLAGRKIEKVEMLTRAINSILPAYSSHLVSVFNQDEKLDAILSFVSAERIISANFAELLSKDGIAVDGGIGNFTESFITALIEKGSKILRLDVRLGLPFLEAHLLSIDQPFLNEVMGEREIEGFPIVAGGIVGKNGAVIVDQIQKPKQIIGIANGIGGVKHESTLTDADRYAIKTVKRYLL